MNSVLLVKLKNKKVMKKSILAIASLSLGSIVFAQNEKVYTPVKGDWAIGIDAAPFLNYFGNFIGGDGANVAPSWNYLTTNQTITGKYFASDDMAYRGSLRLGFGSMGQSAMVADRASTVIADYPSTFAPEVENTMNVSSTTVGLSGGVEWRKGSGRLVGFYGGELGIALSSSQESYTYGNVLSLSTAASPVAVDAADDFGGNVGPDAFGFDSRTLEQKNGATFGIGLRGFIGAEYFVLPKLSIGGEFGWGLMFVSNGANSLRTESVGFNAGGTEIVGEVETTGDKSSMFGIDTDANNTVFGPATSLRITLHF